MIRPIVHIVLHFLVPGALARGAFGEKWKNAWGIMMLTMIVDIDHLLASPIYDPDRCGIGFHPLHSYPAIAVYVVLAVAGKTRVAGIGLLVHMALDGLDCFWMG